LKIYGDVISPFVRMCLITAHEVGVKDKVALEKVAVKPTEAHNVVAKLSPIGKIPVLETDHHHAIYDSRVIIEYLAHVGGSRTIIPDDGVKRFRVLTLMALAQGMAEAAVALRYEQAQRPQGKQWDEFMARSVQRIMSGASDIEAHWQDALVDVHAGTISLACALSYIDLRHPTLDWRKGHHKLTDFHRSFEQRESMKAWPIA
jgi:glutathione S-transferase